MALRGERFKMDTYYQMSVFVFIFFIVLSLFFNCYSFFASSDVVDNIVVLRDESEF